MMIDGIDSVVAGVRIPSTDWYVVTTQPADAALGSTYDDLKRNALLLVAIIVAVSMLGWAIAERIIGPVQSLADTATRIHDGDLSTRMPSIGPIEIRDVANEFNAMLDKLTEAQGDIRAIVDHSVDGLITIGERGIVQSFSKPAEAIFGYTSDEVVGRNVSMLMAEPDRSRHDG